MTEENMAHVLTWLLRKVLLEKDRQEERAYDGKIVLKNMLKQQNQINNGEENLQQIGRDGGQFIIRDGFEGRNPHEEEDEENLHR